MKLDIPNNNFDEINSLVDVILTIVGDWGNQCASLSRTDCFWFEWTTPLRR